MNVCIHNSRALLPYQPQTIKLQLLYTDPFCCTRIGDHDILRKCRRPAAWKKTQTKPSCIHLWCPVCQRRRARRQLESSPCRRAGLAHSKTSFKLLANSLCSLNEFTQQQLFQPQNVHYANYHRQGLGLNPPARGACGTIGISYINVPVGRAEDRGAGNYSDPENTGTDDEKSKRLHLG